MSTYFFTALVVALSGALIVFFLGQSFVTRAERKKNKRLLTPYSATSLPNSGSSKTSRDELLGLRFSQWFLRSRYGRWFSVTSTRAGVWHLEDLYRRIWIKVQLALGALIIGFLLFRQGNASGWLSLVLLPLIAFFAPDLLVMSKAEKRIEVITRALPETIDLLTMCVHAGLGFQAGLLRISQTQSNPLSEEISRVLSEMRLGESRSKALLSMSDRLNIEPLRQFVNAVLQVDRLGIPIAKVLEDQSASMRASMREKAREQAQKVPVKILAPIMIFLMPALLIIVLGPAIVTIIRAFS